MMDSMETIKLQKIGPLVKVLSVLQNTPVQLKIFECALKFLQITNGGQFLSACEFKDPLCIIDAASEFTFTCELSLEKFTEQIKAAGSEEASLTMNIEEDSITFEGNEENVCVKLGNLKFKPVRAPILELPAVDKCMMLCSYSYIKMPVSKQIISTFKAFSKPSVNLISLCLNETELVIKDVEKELTCLIKKSQESMWMESEGTMKTPAIISRENWEHLAKFVEVSIDLDLYLPQHDSTFPIIALCHLCKDYQATVLCGIACSNVNA